jgi:hypothetical protein
VEWIIAIAVVLAILIFVFFLALRRRKSAAAPSDNSRSSAATKRITSRLSAAEMLSRVHDLRDANAQWDVIWSQLNPNADADVQSLLIEIRGPHMFAPHLGLGVIEDGCRRVLAASPDADALAALREAVYRAKPFVG